MALKHNKISREISRQVNRYLTVKSDASIKPEPQNIQNDSNLRYALSNIEKPNLPQIEFAKDFDEVPEKMKHLQPSMLPSFIDLQQTSERVVDKWADSFVKR
ncbi:unnamed protein product [Acanthoscelides obtectus]|uniref:Uncharacterized protein n=1 Tax=Acanthoscelides obtectus TaxID=200917 RepID=A0A9P0L2B8_ACAOB|nr:unnamed protein product [Acanthoscelides obtectus]CAK1649252.1 hypothetical protein AOBTE_LOCUS16110 [Acanthoscelides obtectus]